MKKTNIEDKLRAYRSRKNSQQDILNQVKAILYKEEFREACIFKRLNSSHPVSGNNFDHDLLVTDRIYHIEQIKQICIDYRLRFLNSKYFKGDYPSEAIAKIKELDSTHQIEVSGFKIVAPSKLFKLKNADDPLLFAPIGNDYFYLIHKWGNDLHPLRKIFMLPFKNLLNLTILILLLSAFCTMFLPMHLFSKESSISTYLILYFFIFKAIAAVTIFYGFALGKNFNYAIWNSKYFNA